MTAPARLVRAALAKEATFGVAAAPVLVLPWSTLTPVDNAPPLPDLGWRGSAASVYGHEVGVQDSQIQLAGPVFPDSIGLLLAGITGDYMFAAGTPNTHTFATKNTGTQQPPSYTVSISDPTGLTQWAGCKIATLTLTYAADALLTHQATLQGLPSTVPGTLAMPAPGAELPMPGWVCALQVGGTSEPRLLSGTVTLTRAVTSKRNITGVQAPWLQRSESLTVTGKLELAIASDTYRALFLAGTARSVDLTYTLGAGAALRRLQVHCSSVAFTAVARDYGQKWVEVAASFEAAATTADAGASGGLSPVKVTLRNQVGSGVYA